MLSDLPANGQFNVSIDPDVDNDWPIFNRNGLIYLAEIVGPVNAKALGPEADGQFFEIWLNDFRIFREVTPCVLGRAALAQQHCR